MTFRIDVLDASGNRLSGGPITSVIRLDTTQSLDRIGEMSFTMPAGDARAQYIATGCRFDVFDDLEGYIGRYIYKSSGLTDDSGQAMLRVSAYDQLKEMQWVTVGFRRKYANVDVAAVVADLALQAGWSALSDSNIGHTSVTYEGENVFTAIDVLRDRWGQHFRYAATSLIEFGSFGAASGVRLTNLSGQIGPLLDTAILKPIRQTVDADAVANRIIPLGAGQGTAQLTIQQALAQTQFGTGHYPVLTGTNQDGSHYYYIEDAASIAKYGLRTKIVTFTQARPLSNSATDIQYAATTLKLYAEAYIKRHLEPIVEYAIETPALPKKVRVGDTVRLAYRGASPDYAYLNVDDDFYVMDMVTSRDVNGNRSTRITVSSLAERRTADTDVMVDVVRDIAVLKLHVQPSVVTWSYVYLDTIQSSNPTQTSGTYNYNHYKEAVFKVPIDNNITYVTKVKLVMRTSQLYVAAKINSNPVWFPDYRAQILLAKFWPANIHIRIDGVDRTAELGGMWGTKDRQVEVELDITDFIVNSPLGLQGSHPIVFYSTPLVYPLTTDNAYPGYLAGSPSLDTGGWIELTIAVQGVAMPIVPV